MRLSACAASARRSRIIIPGFLPMIASARVSGRWTPPGRAAAPARPAGCRGRGAPRPRTVPTSAYFMRGREGGVSSTARYFAAKIRSTFSAPTKPAPAITSTPSAKTSGGTPKISWSSETPIEPDVVERVERREDVDRDGEDRRAHEDADERHDRVPPAGRRRDHGRAGAQPAHDEADAQQEATHELRPDEGLVDPQAGQVHQAEPLERVQADHRHQDGGEHDLEDGHVVQVELGRQLARRCRSRPAPG